MTAPDDPRADFWRLIALHENARACRLAAETRLAEAQRSTDSHRASEAKLRSQIEAWLGDGAAPAPEAPPSPEGAFTRPEILAGCAAADGRRERERVPCTVCKRHPCECPPPAKKRPRGRKAAAAEASGEADPTRPAGAAVAAAASPGATTSAPTDAPSPSATATEPPPAREGGEGSSGAPATRAPAGGLFGDEPTRTAAEEGS